LLPFCVPTHVPSKPTVNECQQCSIIREVLTFDPSWSLPHPHPNHFAPTSSYPPNIHTTHSFHHPLHPPPQCAPSTPPATPPAGTTQSAPQPKTLSSASARDHGRRDQAGAET